MHMRDFSIQSNMNLDGVIGVHLSPIRGKSLQSKVFGRILKNGSKFRMVKCNYPKKLLKKLIVNFLKNKYKTS